MKFQELNDAVIRWAEARDILANSKPEIQLLKCVSELGELSDAEIKHDLAGIIDGVGDVLVTLIIYAEMKGLLLEGCLESAYDTIKDRKGRLSPSGVFVKDAT
ncbi:MAG: hypothetical protein EBU90_26785 [Proteobacteria bacterium]|nr:hypothetical protein [Pseudomonadota bacterium]